MKLLPCVTEASCLTSSRLFLGVLLKVTRVTRPSEQIVCTGYLSSVYRDYRNIMGVVSHTAGPVAQRSGAVAVLSQEHVMCN